MNRWDIAGVPHKGWACEGVNDLEDAVHTCEMCGKESIRFVHVMQHADYAGRLQVGCICAEKMADGYDGKRAQRRVSDRATRKAKCVDSVWKVSKKGNCTFKKINGRTAMVGCNQYGWWVKAAGKFLPKPKTEVAAKKAAFDELDPK